MTDWYIEFSSLQITLSYIISLTLKNNFGKYMSIILLLQWKKLKLNSVYWGASVWR